MYSLRRNVICLNVKAIKSQMFQPDSATSEDPSRERMMERIESGNLKVSLSEWCLSE